VLLDFVVIGGGQAGIPLAHALAGEGKSTVLIESKHLGGSCINYGCTPTKAAIVSADLAHQARRASEFGIEIPEVRVNFKEVIRQARQIAENSRHSLDGGFEKSPHLSLIRGHARLAGRDEKGFIRILVEGREPILARQVILNLGAESVIPPIPGLDSKHVLFSENWLDLNELPEHLVMIGSGYIGVEMGQFYRRMGSRVTMLEHGDQILGHEDHDVAEAIEGFLEKEGIRFFKRTPVQALARQAGGGWTVRLESRELSASHVFVATGRKASTQGAGLETLGIETDPHGYVRCNARLQTNVAGVWVAGDIRGGPLFTHTSWDDYRILVSQILGDGSRTLDRIVPYAIFCDPELGRVGLSEKQALQEKRSIQVSRFNFSDNGKANEIREARGFIKLVIEKDVLLGAAVLGPLGSELVQLYVTLMNVKANVKGNASPPLSVMRDAIYIHPTLAEAAQSATSAIQKLRSL
jgi:pyruvate/2-oxoglutarate dehydrogenase complex dihydrolipoamide dehydrogenase (E3) component